MRCRGWKKLSFGLHDDALEELRRELIGTKRLAADVDGERLVWAPDGRMAQPERTALRLAERPPDPAAVRDLPSAERRHLTVMFCGGFWCEACVWRIFGGKLARDEPGQAC